MSNLTQRVLTAVVALPLVIGLIWLGGWPFSVFIAALAVLGQQELFRLLAASGPVRPLRILGAALAAAVAVRAQWPYADTLVIGGLLVALVVELWRRDGQPLLNVSGLVVSLFYPALLVSYLPLLRAGSPWLTNAEAFWLTLTVFLLIWATDTLAYFTGLTFSRRGTTHPLFPRVSPKKTWEGSIGGLVGALVVAVVLQRTALPFLALGDALALGLLCGGLGQLGDLVESLFKRAAGVKDSATWLPGHGGILDRFDALLLAAPLAYLYLSLFTPLF